jgi:WD40 repeat protein
MFKMTFRLFFAVLFAGLVVGLSCCEDCPTCPKEEEPEPNAYYVYMSDISQSGEGYIWVVNSKTDSLIDSIAVPDSYITVMDISSDGQFLSVLGSDSRAVYVINTATKELVKTINGGYPNFSYDDQYLIVSFGNELYKYSTTDWGLLATYDLQGVISNECLFNRSHRFCCMIDYDDEYIIFNYETGAVEKRDTLNVLPGGTMGVRDIVSSIEDEYLYCLEIAYIFKYDYNSDSVLDSIPILYGAWHGELKNSVDGKYTFYNEVTDPWNLNYSPVGNLLIIKQPDFTIYRRIPTWGLVPTLPYAPSSPGKFDLTPDGYNVICGSNTSLPPIKFDIQNLNATNINIFTSYSVVTDIAIGKKIE